MKTKTAGALLLSAILLMHSSAPALAQSANGGFIDTLKGMAKDPLVRSLVISKISGSQTAQTVPFLSPVPTAVRQNSGLASAAKELLRQNLSGANPAYSGNLINKILPAGNNSNYSNALINQVLPAAMDRLVKPNSNHYLSSNSASHFKGPSSGFYSLEEGRALGGGTGYSSELPSQANGTLSNSSVMTISQQLDAADLQHLSKYEISVLIDRSGSMATRDCPDPIRTGANLSRWQWCQEQSRLLQTHTAGALPQGINIVPFAGTPDRYSNVSPQAISSIFKNSAPSGSTNLALALKSEFDRYFLERDAGVRQRPLMLAVITDGMPDSKSAVRKVMQEAAMRMHNPNEIKVSFYLIGSDRNGEAFINELIGDLAGNEMSEHMVSTHSFWEVNRLGLARTLASTIARQENSLQSLLGKL